MPEAHQHQGIRSRDEGFGLPQDRGAEQEVEEEECDEVFWGRRGANIQRLFTAWDCNQLSNDAFTVQLQHLLGDRVDVSSAESEFVRLSNKHRDARNLKFASLMSALRRDAQSTLARRYGQRASALPSYRSSTYAESERGSVYEPSEAGSEAPSHAAGRPTNAVQAPAPVRGGKRHYMYGDSSVSSGPASVVGGGGGAYPDRRMASCPEDGYLQTRPPLASPHSGSTYSRNMDGTQLPRSPTAPPAFTSSPRQDELEGRGVGPAPTQQDIDPWQGRRGPPSVADQSDTMSQCDVQSVAGSVADSQREVFTTRNRTGHGNILTWGSDSRSITPHKTRGRQLTVDPQHGVPRSQMSSGIFPRKQ